MEVPHVDLPLRMLAWTNVDEDILNIYKQSCRLHACIIAICTEGKMKVSINLLEYEVKSNDLIVLLPGSIIQFHEETEKVRLCFAGFSAACIGSINLIEAIGYAYSRLIEQPIISLTDSVASYLNDYITLLSKISCNQTLSVDPKMADLSLQTILTSIQLMYKNHPEQHQFGRKKEIYRNLIQLITKHYKEERCVQFYADKLGISLQYLSTTVRNVTGKNVLSTIAYIVIIDAKSKLKGTTMTIQEISYSLNFPNASFFCKFFRRHVGMSPAKFRRS